MRLTITQKINLALLVPAVGAVLALLAFYAFLAQTAADSSFINIAGRQRMLAQQLFSYAHMVHIGQEEDRPYLHGLIEEFEHSLTALEHGGEIIGRRLPTAPVEVLEEITAVKRLWGEHKKLLLTVAKAPAKHPRSKRAYDELESSIHLLVEMSHGVVSSYEARSEMLRRRMLYTFLAIAVFDAVLFVVGAWAARRYLAERRRAEEALRQSERDWRLTFDSISDMVSLHDKDFRILRANKALADFFGVRPEELIGKRCCEVFHGTREPVANCPLTRTLQTRTPVSHEIDDPHLGCPMQISTSPVFDASGAVVAVVHVAKDITERKRTEKRLQHLAHYDHLTHLPNRALFFDRLNQALVHAHRHERQVAVLFIDLDRFKVINDTLGHDTADLLLQAVAKRLTQAVRAGDTVARFGGDEFVIALDDIAEESHVRQITEKIMRELGSLFVLEGRELFVTASIGVSLYPRDGADANTLVRNADASMYRAKELGKNMYQVYSPALHRDAPRRLALETNLRRALEREEFLLYYQPRVELAGGRISGVEALLRWRHPELGIVAPAEFIPLLEETGLIVPVGEWVLHTAYAQNRAWRAAGLEALCMSVNLSARQFLQRDLVETFARVLRDTGLEPRCLEIELTESIIMEHTEESLASLRDLSALGIRLTLDDFGTGYSSLSYLRRFPIDTLKIDRSFVRDITADPDDAAIVQAVIAMAHRLDITVVAEGVETKAQLDFLCANRCDEIQGFYFSRPVPAEEITQLLREGRHLDECRHASPKSEGRHTAYFGSGKKTAGG
jgi:diguanylate cyclase (GGDEF)-like protein/PAS domain S-box-containing protein